MPERERDGCPTRRGLHLPDAVGGLVQAMRACVEGDLVPLESRNLKRFPILRGSLEAWTHNPDLGDRLACGVVQAAFQAASAGREIHKEAPWMAKVARHLRARIRRDDRQIGVPLAADVNSPVQDPLDALIRQENRDRVRRVIAILPPKYRFPMRVRYVHGLTEADTASLIETIHGTRAEGTRWILKEGRKIVRTGLEGGDPRVVYTDRYPGGSRLRKNSP